MNATQSITIDVIGNITASLRDYFAAKGCAFTPSQERALADIVDVSTWSARAEIDRVKAEAADRATA